MPRETNCREKPIWGPKFCQIPQGKQRNAHARGRAQARAQAVAVPPQFLFLTHQCVPVPVPGWRPSRLALRPSRAARHAFVLAVGYCSVQWVPAPVIRSTNPPSSPSSGSVPRGVRRSVHEPLQCPREYEEQFPHVEPKCTENWEVRGCRSISHTHEERKGTRVLKLDCFPPHRVKSPLARVRSPWAEFRRVLDVFFLLRVSKPLPRADFLPGGCGRMVGNRFASGARSVAWCWRWTRQCTP